MLQPAQTAGLHRESQRAKAPGALVDINVDLQDERTLRSKLLQAINSGAGFDLS